jgi:hypothetical protein
MGAAVTICAVAAVLTAASPRGPQYFVERAVRDHPSIHEVGERVRISKGIDPNRMMQFTGTHDAGAFPDDSDPSDADEFLKAAYADLAAEIRGTYAELASIRGQSQELRRSLDLTKSMVDLSHALYAEGKLDQAQPLEAHMDFLKLSDRLLLLDRREKIVAIRLNVLTGDRLDDPVPALEALPDAVPELAVQDLIEDYKSRRFLNSFEQVIGADITASLGNVLHHGLDSLDVEATAFLSVARISMDSLSVQLRRCRESLIPASEQAQAARLEAYKIGKSGFPELLKGLRELIEMRREYFEMLGDLHVVRARVEAAIGRSLDPQPEHDMKNMPELSEK